MGVVLGVMGIGGPGGSGKWCHGDRGSGWEWCVGSLGEGRGQRRVSGAQIPQTYLCMC